MLSTEPSVHSNTIYMVFEDLIRGIARKVGQDSRLYFRVNLSGPLFSEKRISSSPQKKGALYLKGSKRDRRRATLPTSCSQYHRRGGSSLLCSEWEQVFHPRYNHRKRGLQLLKGARWKVKVRSWKSILRYNFPLFTFYFPLTAFAAKKANCITNLSGTLSRTFSTRKWRLIIGIKPHGILVLVSFTYHYASTSSLSTS